ncbi:helix-turn-helix transcriptional regulator [Aquimarina sp. U1-2]|uniref:AraC family transcriptional regulator n=1 Tax=Aquimarina sp. U1-2 TaxID=2823141 RepID=UPI001AEC831A|nr:AraC family transcriptional regulator [Aquimarina sp. U1-2]MBP2832926.1 helix-turn-helix transcriptional regulator [Aquimarina sp. U1-2]
MNRFLVSSLPIPKVIADLARNMEVSYFLDCDYIVLDIPEKYGEGFIKGMDFGNGLGIIAYDCKFKEDTQIDFVLDRVHPLKFLCCAGGTFIHQFSNENIDHQLQVFDNAIVASSHQNGHVLKFSANERIQLNSLEINRIKYIKYIECYLKGFNKDIIKLFQDIRGVSTFFHQGYYSYKSYKIFYELVHHQKEDLLRRLFYESCANEVLFEQIIQFEDDVLPEDKMKLFRSKDLQAIENAAKYIRKNISSKFNIKDLAKIVGINENKLQKGFQELYDQSVNAYVTHVRLEIITNLLLNTDLNISEISYKVGISSISYVSKIFRNQYGISPSEYRDLHSENR